MEKKLFRKTERGEAENVIFLLPIQAGRCGWPPFPGRYNSANVGRQARQGAGRQVCVRQARAGGSEGQNYER